MKSKTKNLYMFFLQRIILFLFIIYSSFTYAQTKPKLYYALINLGPKSETFFNTNNIQIVHTMDSRYYAPNPEEKIDYGLFEKSINLWFPNINSEGIAVLDWEGKMGEALHNRNVNSSEFKDALAKYIQLIKFAKKYRPKVQWGCFGIPFTAYWYRNQWDQSNMNLLPLIKECDILCPCFYIYYKEGSEEKGGNIAFAQDNIKKCLILVHMVNNTPILPYIWNRYYDTNKEIGLELIPINEFNNYIRAILNTSYLGQKAAGVVWWGADKDYYNLKKLPLVNEFKKSGKKDFKDYDDNLTVQYGTQMLKAVNGK